MRSGEKITMLKCPKCGNELEFYTKERYKGICDYYFRTDGERAYNAEMYDYAIHTYRSKFVFCTYCDARVCKIEDIAEIS